jgi:hypothetical protein
LGQSLDSSGKSFHFCYYSATSLSIADAEAANPEQKVDFPPLLPSELVREILESVPNLGDIASAIPKNHPIAAVIEKVKMARYQDTCIVPENMTLFANVSSRIARKERGFTTNSTSQNGWDVSLRASDGSTLSVKWELKFKASRDGFSTTELHQKCDGGGKYVAVVKAINNRIAIAYNGDGFSSSGGHTANKNGFIVSMKEDGSYGTQFDRNAREGQGIRNYRRSSNTGYDDLTIYLEGKCAGSGLGLRYGEGPEANDTTLFGQSSIDVRDYEVFKITI